MQYSTQQIRKSQPVAGLRFCLLSQAEIVQSVMPPVPAISRTVVAAEVSSASLSASTWPDAVSSTR